MSKMSSIMSKESAQYDQQTFRIDQVKLAKIQSQFNELNQPIAEGVSKLIQEHEKYDIGVTDIERESVDSLQDQDEAKEKKRANRPKKTVNAFSYDKQRIAASRARPAADSSA